MNYSSDSLEECILGVIRILKFNTELATNISDICLSLNIEVEKYSTVDDKSELIAYAYEEQQFAQLKIHAEGKFDLEINLPRVSGRLVTALQS